MDLLRTALEVRLEAAGHQARINYLKRYRSGDTDLQPILDIGLIAMAKADLNGRSALEGYFDPPGWVGQASRDLKRFILQDEAEHDILRASVLYDPSIEMRHRLGRIVSASVTPAGLYDVYDFGSGVADGLIVARRCLSDRPAADHAAWHV